MYERFTDRSRKVMQLANEEAKQLHHEYIGTEHILLGLIKERSGVAANVLKNLDVDLRKIRLEVEKIVQVGPGGDSVVLRKLPHTPRAKKVIENAIEEARALNHNYVGTEHLLLGLIREEEGVAAQVLMNLGLGLEEVRTEVLNLIGEVSADTPDPKSDARLSGPFVAVAPQPQSRTPALDLLGKDLTDLCRQGNLEPLIGRQSELQALVEVLACRDRKRALLRGEQGTGKRALIAGLAHAIEAGRMPHNLARCRVVRLEFHELCDTIRGKPSEVGLLRAVFNEVRRSRETILFLPDTVAALAASGGGVIAQQVHTELLLNLRGDAAPLILAASPAEYVRFARHRGALDNSVQTIELRPANVEEAIAVLRGVSARYEQFHRVRATDEALTAIAASADRVLPGALPGKAVQLLDRCAARLQMRAWGLSPDELLAVRTVRERIEELERQKEEAVAKAEFHRAAELRDEVDRLKKSKEWLVHDQAHNAVLEVRLVEELAGDLAALSSGAKPA